MSHLLCNVDACKRKCCVLCYCCNKNLCFNHLKDHRDLIQSQLNILVNEINIINDQFMILNAQNDSSKNSNDTYENFLVERRTDQIRNVINQLRSTISQLISEQDTTNENIILLTLNIRSLKKEIEAIKQIIISDNLSSLITQRIISIEQLTTNDFDLSTLSSSFQTIICHHPLG